MKICPKCGKVLSYNSYFGAYICNTCSWEDASQKQKRNKRAVSFYANNSKKVLRPKKKMIVAK